jgi:nitroreductase
LTGDLSVQRTLPPPVYAGVDEGEGEGEVRGEREDQGGRDARYERRSRVQAPVADELQRVGCISEYDDRPIEDEVLAAIVRAAAWAPSAANIQPWEIVALRSEDARARVGDCLLDSHLRPNVGGEARRSWVCSTPLLLVVCLDRTRAKTRYGDIGAELFGIQDTGAAIQNMRLVGLGLGIKSCLVREFDREKLAAMLELPSHVRPLIMIAMGYANLEARPLPRLPLSDYLHYERW